MNENVSVISFLKSSDLWRFGLIITYFCYILLQYFVRYHYIICLDNPVTCNPLSKPGYNLRFASSELEELLLPVKILHYYICQKGLGPNKRNMACYTLLRIHFMTKSITFNCSSGIVEIITKSVGL